MDEDRLKNYEHKVEAISRKFELISVRLKLLSTNDSLQNADVNNVTCSELLLTVDGMRQTFARHSAHLVQNCREQRMNIRELNEVSKDVKEAINNILKT